MSARATRRWRELATAAAIAAAVAVCAPEASAQKNQGPSNSLQGFSQNRDQPVRIRAAVLEVREKDKIATFTGDVHVVNGDTELRCKALTVFYDDDGGAKVMKAVDSGPGGERQVKRIEAKGGVTVVQKDQNAAGDTAIFNMRDNTVTLVGNVIVTQGGSVMRGQRLVVDLTSGVSKMDRADVLLPRGAGEARKP
jgi:lipopolysaccharide export system protein LptA